MSATAGRLPWPQPRVQCSKRREVEMRKVSLGLGLLIAAGMMAGSSPADAVVYCQYVGVPKGCVVRPGVVLRPAPVVAPSGGLLPVRRRSRRMRCAAGRRASACSRGGRCRRGDTRRRCARCRRAGGHAHESRRAGQSRRSALDRMSHPGGASAPPSRQGHAMPDYRVAAS
jgi:hypothetical protein